ncbi:MAG: extracellular solute-binding protein [Devosia sp.]
MKLLLRTLLLVSTPALVAALPAVATAQDKAVVPVLMIGYPDEDSVDAVTGVTSPGIGKLEAAFEAANPDIDLVITNIPWGSGATGYATKTEAMIQGGEACLYEMPGAAGYGRRGLLVDLNSMIAADPNFVNVWGRQLETLQTWGPENPKSLFYIPDNTGERVIHWDAKLFEDFGVEPLSTNPTIEEIEEKAPMLTGKNPVTGEDTYGYWYQGKYAVWQYMAIAHALGANWGTIGKGGKLDVNWDTPEFLAALEWFVKMSKYAPAGALAGDGMPQGFLTDQNVVAIIPEGEQGYFIQPLIASPELQQRFRSSFNLRGEDGLGGLNSVSPLAMAANCSDKKAGWTALKWLAGSPESQRYYFESNGRLPVTENGSEALPQIAAFPDGEVVLTQPLFAEAPYPWAAEQPRWALQTALEAALAGTVTPAEALAQAQKETADWIAQQQAAN